MAETQLPTKDLEQKIAAIVTDYPDIAATYLFGSVARSADGPQSDVDIGIVFRQRGQSALDHHRMIGDLASRLEAITAPRMVDVVVLEDQGPIFAHRVLLEGRLVLETDAARRVDFESETIVRALDFRPTYEIAARHAVEGMRRWLKRRAQ